MGNTYASKASWANAELVTPPRKPTGTAVKGLEILNNLEPYSLPDFEEFKSSDMWDTKDTVVGEVWAELNGLKGYKLPPLIDGTVTMEFSASKEKGNKTKFLGAVQQRRFTLTMGPKGVWIAWQGSKKVRNVQLTGALHKMSAGRSADCIEGKYHTLYLQVPDDSPEAKFKEGGFKLQFGDQNKYHEIRLLLKIEGKAPCAKNCRNRVCIQKAWDNDRK